MYRTDKIGCADVESDAVEKAHLHDSQQVEDPDAQQHFRFRKITKGDGQGVDFEPEGGKPLTDGDGSPAQDRQAGE